MDSKMILEIHSSDQRLIKALYEALYPDNVDLPKGLDLNMQHTTDRLTIQLRSTSRFETLISTVEEILEDIHSALSSIDAVKR